MPGSVALVGAGEFLPAMGEFDQGLLVATGRSRPRVAILATASFPDGEEVDQRRLAMGVEHFGRLGAEVEPVLVRERGGADDGATAQAVGEADLIYLSGSRPGYLLGALEDTVLGRSLVEAHARGAIVVGCSAGAMVLADRQFDYRFRGRPIPWPLRWRRSLGFIPGVAVIPHYDVWPEPLSALVVLQAPRGSTIFGIDEDTAVVGRDGSFQVHGRARVTVWRGRHRERFRAGEVFRV
jgi:cyanophycinase